MFIRFDRMYERDRRHDGIGCTCIASLGKKSEQCETKSDKIKKNIVELTDKFVIF